MTSSVEQALQQFGQTHLLDFWNDLSDKERNDLIADIESIDFEHIANLVQVYIHKKVDGDKNTDANRKIEPLPKNIRGSKLSVDQSTLEQYQNQAFDAIKNSKVAALLLAGGQGTRLGLNSPKGMLDVNLESHKTLYQLQAERIRKLETIANNHTNSDDCKIMWYIMTSESTKDDTEEFMSTNAYFGLDEKQVIIFEQNTLPCLTFEGKIILDQKHKISRAPDGNGGLYTALKQRNILDDMVSRGIECVHVYCVDNILVRVCDPSFVGYCLSKGVDVGAKIVRKVTPNESVGVICKVGDHFKVIEYSELSTDMAEMRDDTGGLVYDAGNICEHFFKISFLKKLAEKPLSYHVAVKKIPYVGQRGNRVNPNVPNGIKLEKFIFDSFEYAQADRFAVWEVDRKLEFAPIKNADAPGANNSPTTAREALLEVQNVDGLLSL